MGELQKEAVWDIENRMRGNRKVELTTKDVRILRAMRKAIGLRSDVSSHGPGGSTVSNYAKKKQYPMLSTGTFLAKITGNASLTDNRWKYAWTEVVLSADLIVDKTDGRSGTTTVDYALNLSEMYHTATYAWGVDVTGDDYPAGFGVRPVGGGGAATTHRYDVIVEMRVVTDTATDADPTTRYVFSAMGSHDGTCDA